MATPGGRATAPAAICEWQPMRTKKRREARRCGFEAAAMRRFGGGRPGWFLGVALLLGGCAHGMHSDANSSAPPPPTPQDAEINVPPANYKADILGAMHAYLNDPTGIRDAGISEPALKGVSGHPRYVVCVRYNAKKRGGQGNQQGNQYAGVKELAAVFMVGKFDRFVETRERPQEQSQAEQSAAEQNPREQKAPGICADVAFAPFPELQKLSR
jgi:hypothetical protein